MVNDLIIIRLKNVDKNKKNKLLTYLKHNSFSYIEINKNTFYEKEKQMKGKNEHNTIRKRNNKCFKYKY
jgi:hypothetical protein